MHAKPYQRHAILHNALAYCTRKATIARDKAYAHAQHEFTLAVTGKREKLFFQETITQTSLALAMVWDETARKLVRRI